MAKLDDLLQQAANDPDPAAGLGLSAKLLAELDAKPARGWKGDLLLVVGLCAALISVAGAVMFFAGALDPALLVARAGNLVALFLVGAFCAFAAVSPRKRGRVLAGFGAAAFGVAGLVLVRGAGVVSTAAPWVCTLSHLSIGAGPLVAALLVLRKSALSSSRAALAGLAVGSTGAMLGELACEQSWAHVAVWHLGAWLGLAVLSVVVARRLVPRSFAP